MFTSAHDASEFTLAGNATLTLKSNKTGAHFTYRITSPKENTGLDNNIRFVNLLTGPDNDSDYTYIGLLRNVNFQLTRASKLPLDSKPVAAFRFFAKNVLLDGKLPSNLEIRHNGKCGRCGRPLTVPESIDRGIGPECARHMSVDNL